MKTFIERLVLVIGAALISIYSHDWGKTSFELDMSGVEWICPQSAERAF